MRWLWYVGPLTVALVYLLVAFWPSSQLRRRTRELRRWVDEFLGPLDATTTNKRQRRSPKGDRSRTASRWIGRLPRAFQSMIEAAGTGSTLANIVLIPKLAYLAVRSANRVSSTDHQTVVARLAKPAPSMIVRPLPLVEGRRVDNRGVQFKKDPEFMDHFLVEGGETKAVIKWLRPSIREALIESPDIWLRTEGRVVAVTLYGEATAERLDELVAAADAVFAERGAGRAPSLFGDEDYEPTSTDKKKPKPAPVAPLGPRLGAGIVDAVLYAVAAAIIIVVLAMREGGWADVSVVSLLGPGPSDPLDGAWQGGWTTKGFGALVAAECFLCGLFVYQTYLAARRGESIGKKVFGAQVVRLDGEPLSFLRGVLLRTWVIAALPLGVAALLTQQLDARAYLQTLFDWRVLAAALAAIVIDLLLLLVGSQRRSLHDYTAGTRVVSAPGGVRRLLEL